MEKDDDKVLTFCHLAVAAIIFMITGRALDALGVSTGWSDRYEQWYGTVNTVLSIILAMAVVWYVRSKADWREYHLAAIAELRKVKWPSFDETKKMTRIVVVVVGIFGLVVAAFDYFWAWCLSYVLL